LRLGKRKDPLGKELHQGEKVRDVVRIAALEL
jgi:hypothetical protein